MKMEDIKYVEKSKNVYIAQNIPLTNIKQAMRNKKNIRSKLRTLTYQINVEKKKITDLIMQKKQIQSVIPNVPVNNKSVKKNRKAQLKQMRYYRVEQTVMEQMVNENQVPSTSMIGLETGVTQQPQPNAAIMTPEQGLVQYSGQSMMNQGQGAMQYPGRPMMHLEQSTMTYQGPDPTLVAHGHGTMMYPGPDPSLMAPGQYMQYSMPPMMNPGQSTMMHPGSDPTMMALGQGTMQYPGPYPVPGIMNNGDGRMQYPGPYSAVLTPGQSVQYPGPHPGVVPPGQSVQYPGPLPAVVPPVQGVQYPGPHPAAVPPGQSAQCPGPHSTVVISGQSVQYPGPQSAVLPPGQSVQIPASTSVISEIPYPKGDPPTMSSEQNAWQQHALFPATSEQTGLETKEAGASTLKKKNKIRGAKNKNNKLIKIPPPINYSNVNVNKGSSQFQAPHQNEPEDLTDDLAPNTAGQSVTQQGSQPTTAENKLNFKFQRTVSKKPDWLEFQNKFKRIGEASPNEEPVATVKEEPNVEETVNTGASEGNPRTDSPATASQGQQAAGTDGSKIVIQKVEIVKPADKSTEIASKPVVRNTFPNTSKPKQVRRDDSPNAKNFKPEPNHSFPSHSDRSTGVRQTFPTPYPAYPSYPAGIPRSFIIQMQEAGEVKKEENLQSPPHTHQPEPDYTSQPTTNVDLPSWILPSQKTQPETDEGLQSRGNVAFTNPEPPERAYSPSDVYEAGRGEEELRDSSASPDPLQSGQKRLSAFKRLGPLTQPKKPKLTINLTLNKEEAIREVVDETDEYTPFHLRKDILESTDETVVKYLPFWPWKRNVVLRKTASVRSSKSVMILEQEQMETAYEKNNVFIHVSVKGYPKTWTKEDVLDAILDAVIGKTFIPCFIEFTQKECKFLVIRCRLALLAIHRVAFCIRKNDVELTVSISLTDMSLNQIDLIPRLVLRKRLMNQYDGEKALDLQEFLTDKDVSHFVYFPLSRVTNQSELVQLQSAVAWEYLTELNLSRNRLTSVDGFGLRQTAPRLKILDLSHNYIDKLTILLPLRDLPLRSLKLEGNPLCHDYIDSGHYIKVVRMIFNGVQELDGVRLTLKGDLPPSKRNYCPEAAAPIVEKFLEVFIPLLEAYDDRTAIEDLYHKDAVMTITFRYKLRYGTSYRYFRSLFLHARSLEENDTESVEGAAAITSLLAKWPAIEHDRYSITVDVLHHDDSTTILRVAGVLKLTADSLAEDEHLLTFTRNIVLHTRNGKEYKIHNEMLYWDVPCEEVIRNAFNVTTVRPKQLSVKLESPPDDELKAKLVDIFVTLADIDAKRGARCLELKNWDLRSALEYYVTLLKLDDLTVLSLPEVQTTSVPQAS